MNYEELKVGDKVDIACMTGLGTGGVEEVTEIKTRYREDNGEPYGVIVCGESEYLAQDGSAITPPYAYYIARRYK